MARLGNKWNSFFNGDWATHAKKGGKRRGSKRRRAWGRNEINYQLHEDETLPLRRYIMSRKS